jgi:hypothetical protein
MFKPQIANSYTGDEAWGERSFKDLGFPENHIYCAAGSGVRSYFYLKL